MKKTKLMLFVVLLVIGIFFVMPVKVFGAISEITPENWYDYITQFDDEYVTATIEYIEEWGDLNFAVIIIDAPGIEYDGYYIHYDMDDYGYEEHLESYLKPCIFWWLVFRQNNPECSLAEVIVSQSQGEIDDFDDIIYWNFEEEYWQIDYYNKSEFNNKEVDMVTDLLDTLAEIGTGIGDLFGRIVESVGQFFYTPGTGDTPGSFTIIGILTIAAVVVSLSMWVLRRILRLFKLRG